MHRSVSIVARRLLVLAWLLPSAACLAQSPQFSEAEVTLTTPTGVLAGTELVPASSVAMPAVLLIAGSGATDRDGNSAFMKGANNSLKLLAEGLARKGIASIRYDKRGVGKSALAAGSESSLRFEHYVLDAAAWVSKMRADKRFARVVVVGHSEGSLIGMLASRQAKADEFVSIAGPARPVDEVLRDQLKPRTPQPVFEESERILKALKDGTLVDEVSQPLLGLYRPSVQPYMISWLKYAPRDIITTLRMPVLIVQGTADIQVKADEAALLEAARPSARLVLIDGMNHVFKMVGSDPVLQMTAYTSPDLPVSEQLVTAISNFVNVPPQQQ